MEPFFSSQGVGCIRDSLDCFLEAHKITLHIRGTIANLGVDEPKCSQLLENLVAYRAALCPHGGEILLKGSPSVGRQKEVSVAILSHTFWIEQRPMDALRCHEKKRSLEKMRTRWEALLAQQTWSYVETIRHGGVLWGQLKVPV